MVSIPLVRGVSLTLGLALATAAIAQQAQTGGQAQQPAQPSSAATLNLPQNPELFGKSLPSVVKATAIVNGEVITQTDVDQRLALLSIANNTPIPAAEIDRLRQQVLSNLIDETLQIQAARNEEIEITDADVDKTVARVATNAKQTPDQMAAYLKARGSSIRSIRRQITGEIAWRRLQSKKIESSVSVGDEEVQAVIDKMNASKGAEEFRVGEIFISANSTNEQQALANADRVFAALQQGGSFVGYARQFSEASTAAVGGDLGWVRPEQMPDALAQAIRQMRPGMVSRPIKVQGGYSIVAVQDIRKILTADPRNAVLSLKQVTVSFPQGTNRAAAEPIVARFATAAQNIGGCGGAERIAGELNAEVVQSDDVKTRDLPPALQEMILDMQVGQATRPFGSIEEGVRVLVLCGRDEADPSAPSFDQVYAQLNEERVNLRSRRYLRDLRRDAIIDYR
ncbi:peptidylprolyl isomerase [Sphingomonas sp. NSE70-1]|uniref:Parvulin-like PPIase n=1 Tax=Sphingomonas caseinilyticus TaxID=2908205 RepID=A0ABT0RS11_9SPHN|nr:peptidylprolyl isomerase [Sphingomonas caseinilyticus]MCL6697709.1 peptidylprolyl isomerase [Sphingomonas caseinilyticus]